MFTLESQLQSQSVISRVLETVTKKEGLNILFAKFVSHVSLFLLSRDREYLWASRKVYTYETI